MKPTICVVGLGYIGLPTASMFAVAGHQVLGVDTNPHVAEALTAGEPHFEEPGLQALVRAALGSGNLKVSEQAAPSDVFVIAVPTPLAEGSVADLTAIEAATTSIVPLLQTNNLVILESTVPPRTCLDVIAPLLERSGLKVGQQVLLAHCPERVLPGSILQELVDNARIVGGTSAEAAERAADLYRSFVQGQIWLTDSATAEMAKVLENTYRDVNIALANEVALLSEQVGVNAWEVIRLANQHPRVNLLRPGPGVGGHCIAVDPWFLAQAEPRLARLIRSARGVNDLMPGHVLDLIEQLVGPPNGQALAMLGLTYKPDVDDIRESPALRVAELAREAGYSPRPVDPHLHTAPGWERVFSLADAARGAAALVVLVDHKEFRRLDPAELKGLVARPLVLDTRNCLDADQWRRAGFQLSLLGDGSAC